MTQKIKCRESYKRGYEKGNSYINQQEIDERLDALNRLDEKLIIEALLDLDKKYDTEFMSLYVKVLIKKIGYHIDGRVLSNIYHEINLNEEAN